MWKSWVIKINEIFSCLPEKLNFVISEVRFKMSSEQTMSSNIIKAFSMFGLEFMQHLEIFIYCSTSSKSQSQTGVFVSLEMNSLFWSVLFLGKVGQIIMILSKVSFSRNSFNNSMSNLVFPQLLLPSIIIRNGSIGTGHNSFVRASFLSIFSFISGIAAVCIFRNRKSH